MSVLYGIYGIFTGGLSIFVFPAFWAYSHITGRYRPHLKERLGILPPKAIQRLNGKPRVWIHAASLGEVKVAASIIEALRHILPDSSYLLSTTTEHGRKEAQEYFRGKVPVIYAPIDFIYSVRKALSVVCPDVMVFLETEIWPAWLFEAHGMGIKTALINGRISKRSIRGYLRLRPFFRDVLDNFDAFSMILEEDAARIKAIGADPKKIKINGNAKYDLLGKAADPDIEIQMRQILNLEISQTVFIAGSTREGEEEMILDVYDRVLEKFPDTILIIAPRHLERTTAIVTLVERRGFGCQLWTDLKDENVTRAAQVAIIDSFGELFKIYSIGTIVFCGASLVPLGGQNPLEPAYWEKIVFYGPSMEDFLDATALLEEVCAGVPVSDSEMLADKAIWFIGHPELLEKYGKRGRDAVIKNQGAARKHAEVIKRLLMRNPG